MVDRIIVDHAVSKEALAAMGASFPIDFSDDRVPMGIIMGTSRMPQFFGTKLRENPADNKHNANPQFYFGIGSDLSWFVFRKSHPEDYGYT